MAIGAPDTIVTHTDPNTQLSVTSRIERRSSPGRGSAAGGSLNTGVDDMVNGTSLQHSTGVRLRQTLATPYSRAAAT